MAAVVLNLSRALRPATVLLLALVLVWRAAVQEASASSSLSGEWKQQLPNTDMPEAFEKLASPLSSSDTRLILSRMETQWSRAAVAGGKSSASMVEAAGLECASAGIYCPASSDLHDHKDVIIPVSGAQPRVCVLGFKYEYGVLPCSQVVSAAQVSALKATGIFMHQQSLRAGHSVHVPDTSNDLKGLRFLPSSIATALPQLDAASNLPELARFYGVKEGSETEVEMKNTLALCSVKSKHEESACVASGEGVVSFVKQTIGEDAAVYAAPAMAKQEAKIRMIAVVSSQGQKTVSCHNMEFPSLVYSCHMTQTAQFMDVSLELRNGETVHMPAVCHMDTSYWNPSHVAFQVLNVQPGKSSVCHWFPQNSFIFVSSAS